MRLIKFGAGWCKPCNRLRQVLSEMENPYSVDLIDIEKEPAQKENYQIITLPTLILVDDEGVEQRRLEGLRSVEDFRSFINE